MRYISTILACLCFTQCIADTPSLREVVQGMYDDAYYWKDNICPQDIHGDINAHFFWSLGYLDALNDVLNVIDTQ